MNRNRLAIAVMTVATTMVSAHLPSADQALRQMGRPYQGNSVATRAADDTVEYKFSNIPEWTEQLDGFELGQTLGKGNWYVKHGDFKGTTQYWRANWYPDPGDEPGEFADSGGTSAWGLINSIAFSKDGSNYTWVGWNSNAGKYHTEHDGTDYGLKDVQDGDWGDQIDKDGPGAYVPTWRDGAEGAYSMIHDDIGAMGYDGSVKPAVEVGKSHYRIRAGWGVYVAAMDRDENGNASNDGEWAHARDMVNDGWEMINHSWDHTSAADQWQWGQGPKPADCVGEWKQDTLSTDDPALPPQLRGLIVGDTSDSYGKTISFTIPYIRYENNDISKPIKLDSKIQTYEVSSDYHMDTMYVVNTPDTTYETEIAPNDDSINSLEGDSWVDTMAYAVGKVKPNSTTWYENGTDEGGQGPVLKVFCVPGWEDSQYDMYKVNINLAKDSIDAEVYDKVNSDRFPKGFKTSYYVYPFDAYSKLTHEKLKEAGIIGARGGAKSGFAVPGDFFNPFRIDFDAFFIQDGQNKETTMTDGGNPHQRLTLKGMVDRIVKTKGYMIREFHACADVDQWYEANDQSKGGWWGGVPKSLYEEHYTYLDKLIDEHKIVVFTPTEAVRYRLTANSVTGATLNGLDLKVKTDGSTPEEYRDEISVIVKFADAKTGIEVTYKDGSHPRYKARKMDDEGKAWSVSVNPYKDNGEFTLNDNVAIDNGKTVKSVDAVKFAGIRGGKIALNLPAGDYTAQLFNISGRVVATANINATASNLVTTNLSTENLGKGMFILNVKKAGASVLTHRLMLK